MSTVEDFRLSVYEATRPILAVNKEISLPPDSYRSK
jgi:hypothetical protein